MTAARDTVLGTVRRSLGVTGAEAPRRAAVAVRLAGHPAGIVPGRGHVPQAERIGLFVRMVEAAAGSAEWTPDPAGIPAAIAALLRGLNLPLAIRHGDDERLASLPWHRAGMLKVSRGPSRGNDLAAVSHAFAAVAARLAGHPAGVVPARGHVPGAERVSLFVRMVEAAAGSAEWTADAAGIPAAVAAFLRGLNLPLAIRHGDDQRLASLPWDRAMLKVSRGPSRGDDLAAVSHAFAAVAETGTLVLTSGPDNPTTLNFLPDVHIVAVRASDVAPDFETVMARLRAVHGPGSMPRTVNLITGPSRSADIEQTLILGAHGPRRLHVVVVGEP